MTQDERRIASYLLVRISEGIRPEAHDAVAALTLLRRLVVEVHGASDHTTRRRPRKAAPESEPSQG